MPNTLYNLDMNISDKVIYTIFSIIEGFLVFRILFLLFGANRDNLISKFIYGISNPLVAPFEGLFASLRYGRFVISLNTIIALVFYSIAGFIIIEILNSIVVKTKKRAEKEV